MLAALTELLSSTDTMHTVASVAAPLGGRDTLAAVQVLLFVGIALLSVRAHAKDA